MKHLKIYESFDFNEDDFDWDEENDNLKSGDYVNISTLYDKYPNWSKDNRYMDAVTNNKVLKINRIENASPSDKKRGINKVVASFPRVNNRVFYVPIDVCIYVK